LREFYDFKDCTGQIVKKSSRDFDSTRLFRNSITVERVISAEYGTAKARESKRNACGSITTTGVQPFGYQFLEVRQANVKRPLLTSRDENPQIDLLTSERS
jgi:hypothetical protein